MCPSGGTVARAFALAVLNTHSKKKKKQNCSDDEVRPKALRRAVGKRPVPTGLFLSTPV